MIGTKALVVDDVAPDVFVFGARKSRDIRSLAEMGIDRHQTREIASELVARVRVIEELAGKESELVAGNGPAAKVS